MFAPPPDMPSYFGEEADVCIIGSGAGGGPVAMELAKAGLSVVVLEKGPWIKRNQFNHDEIENSRRNRWYPFVSDEPHLMKTPGVVEPFQTSDGWTANCVGGGTVHMSGFFYRLHPEDFRLATRYGKVEGANVTDWPITYDELAPWYDKVEVEIGLSGKAGGHPFEPPRKGPYPLPSLRHNPLSELVDQGAKKLGLHPFVTPRAVLSKAYKGRAPCVYCNFCGSYGCEVGAKSSSLAACIAQAVETKKCEVRPDCMAFEIELGADGRAASVAYYDKDGKAQKQLAKTIIVSCSSVETARLLLNSKSGRFPDGLANGNGLVGQNLTFSTLAKGWGEFDRTALPSHLREHHPVHFLGRSVQDLYFLPDKKGSYDKGGTLNFLLPHRNPIFTAEHVAKRKNPSMWGAELKDAIKRFYTEIHTLEVEVFGEFLANPFTKVTVDGETKDQWGIPVATIHVENHYLDAAHSRVLVDKALEVFKAAGAVATGIESVGTTTFVLQHGTCRFGKDPATSVLDVNCRAHEVDNLYVVDGSFMPTSGGVPTTLTIMANAFRVADHLVGKLKSTP